LKEGQIIADIVKQTREQERSELHKSIWKIADDLRGAVDSWDFKSYVLGMLFYRYISENIADYINDGEHKAGDEDFNYASLSDADAEFARTELIREKGFFMLPSELFCNVLKLADSDSDLNITLGKIFENIERSSKGSHGEANFESLFGSMDLSSTKLGGNVQNRCGKLVNLLQGIASIKLNYNGDCSIDAFGDAYEYLMFMYASNAGKSGGEFFTPQEVSELLAKIAIGNKKEIDSGYDPTAGSGSLLLQLAKILGMAKIKQGLYGQEINDTTHSLCRINMFLHGVEPNKFHIAHGDTLINPVDKLHMDAKANSGNEDCPPNRDREYEVIVSNPPYSIKWAGSDNIELIDDERYSPAGVLAPKSKADLAFIMHCLNYLSTTGTAAIVCFPGIMYRGGAEQKIRKFLIDGNYVKAVIQLPENLFFGTSIATCIMVLAKNKKSNETLFIDGSKQADKDKLSEDNIKYLFDAFLDFQNIDYVARVVSNNEIVEQDYNLSVSTYVEAEDTREKIDISALNAEIAGIVKNVDRLRSSIDDIVAEIEGGTK
jgi:type I restriction enzyme M protein